MKLKQQSEDFQVEELTDFAVAREGRFACYRLEKRGWTTPDALQAIRRRWKIDARRLSYGGLKDRHALTVQYFTIDRGPDRALDHHGIIVTYLGRSQSAYMSPAIRANRFQITLRDVTKPEVARAEDLLREIVQDGVPNYFDDQRFGSVGKDGKGVGHALVFEQYEEALRLALTEPYEFDRAKQKREKALLRAHWGDWEKLLQELPEGHARRLVGYLLVHPTDFRGAVTKLRPQLGGMYLSAYQSYLWNRMLARWLGEHCREEQLAWVRTRLGELPMHRDLDTSQQLELASLMLPLPSARLHLEPGDPRLALVEAVLAEGGLTLKQLQLKGLRKPFFSKGERGALCQPEHLTHQWLPDEHHPGRHKLILRFELPRGAYGTLIVKRLQR